MQCWEGVSDWICSIADSGLECSQTNEMQPCSFCSVVFGSQPRHVKFNFCFSTEGQQAACLGPIKSTTLVSLLILQSDVKTNKWQRFMSEVNWLLFSIPPGLTVPGVYDDAALRLTLSGKMGYMWLKPFSVHSKEQLLKHSADYYYISSPDCMTVLYTHVNRIWSLFAVWPLVVLHKAIIFKPRCR